MIKTNVFFDVTDFQGAHYPVKTWRDHIGVGNGGGNNGVGKGGGKGESVDMKKGEEKQASATVVVEGVAAAAATAATATAAAAAVSSCVEYAHVGLFDVTFKDGSQRKKVPREDIRFPNMHSTEDVSYCENWTRANKAVSPYL